MNWGLEWPTDKYQVILADPPWSFKSRTEAGQGRSAKKHYKVMKRSDIADLPVKDLRAKRCTLFMWTTPQDMDYAIEVVMPAWGFKYKTDAFIWLKTKRDLERVMKKAFEQWRETGEMPDPLDFVSSICVTTKGYYSRKQAEICLLGTTKEVIPRSSKSVKELIFAPRREHSRKPDETYDRIEELYDIDRYLELFARASNRSRWDAWGNQTDEFEIGDDAVEDFD